MAGVIVERIRFPSSHPALPGHFPQEPIVPGSLLLEEVVAVVRRHGAAGGATVVSVGRVRFFVSVEPEQVVEIRCTPEGQEGGDARAVRWHFECCVAGVKVAAGDCTLSVVSPPAAEEV
ncbi:hypothetical protein [Halorhodospira abdelmalekii]|uniref:hypothetical protein n=1 Tax=Halorhodospira abdelmalekii TaxID=421629 RepID=UPI0019088AEB